jgi:hypothetical protein
MQGICLQCGETKSLHTHTKLCGSCRKANLNHVLTMLREERTELLDALGKVLACAKIDHDKWPLEYAKALSVYVDVKSRVEKFRV